MTVDVHIPSSVTAGLIGVASSLITVVWFTEYYSRPHWQQVMRRVLWGQQR